MSGRIECRGQDRAAGERRWQGKGWAGCDMAGLSRAGQERAWQGGGQGKNTGELRSSLFLHLLVYLPYFLLDEGAFFFWDAVIEIPSGYIPVEGGCVTKWDAVNM